MRDAIKIFTFLPLMGKIQWRIITTFLSHHIVTSVLSQITVLLSHPLNNKQLPLVWILTHRKVTRFISHYMSVSTFYKSDGIQCQVTFSAALWILTDVPTSFFFCTWTWTGVVSSTWIWTGDLHRINEACSWFTQTSSLCKYVCT